MNRDYKAINDEIAITGFFSEYLPPCFKISKQFFNHIPSESCDLIKPLSFSMSRFNNNESRRNISIPEFGAYLVLYNYIKQNDIIQEVVEFCESVNRSFSPILSSDNTIMKHEQSYDSNSLGDEIPSSDYIYNIIRKLKMSTGAKKILKLDISNCYSSFYMHIIPTILLGIEKTEENYKKHCADKNDITIDPMYKKYQKLDAIARRQNLNQTNGLLVGTQYSKIISEGILTRIDIELENKGINYARYVDDYEVFLYDDNEKQVISLFEDVLRKYGFNLNSEKTEIIAFPYYVSKNLEKIFKDKIKDSLTEDELMDLFNTFFKLEEQGIKGSIRYLLKSLETTNFNTNDIQLYKSYLLTTIRNNERSLTKACSILINKKESIMLNNEDISVINEMLKRCLKNKFDLEAIWLCYLLIETDNISNEHNEEIIDSIISNSNELVEIMLLRKGLLSNEQIDKVIKTTNSWIALYELFSMNYIDETVFKQKLSVENNIKMYNKLKKNGLHFVYQ